MAPPLLTGLRPHRRLPVTQRLSKWFAPRTRHPQTIQKRYFSAPLQPAESEPLAWGPAGWLWQAPRGARTPAAPLPLASPDLREPLFLRARTPPAASCSAGAAPARLRLGPRAFSGHGGAPGTPWEHSFFLLSPNTLYPRAFEDFHFLISVSESLPETQRDPISSKVAFYPVRVKADLLGDGWTSSAAFASGCCRESVPSPRTLSPASLQAEHSRKACGFRASSSTPSAHCAA